MKKCMNVSFAYALAAMAGGVFFREFTKYNGFTGQTTLGVVHPHLFMLGCMLFLLLALFSAHLTLTEQKQFRIFFITYNIGLPLMAVMMLVRGTLQVLGTPLSSAANAAISGIAGLTHITVGASLVLLFIALKKAAATVDKQ